MWQVTCDEKKKKMMINLGNGMDAVHNRAQHLMTMMSESAGSDTSKESDSMELETTVAFDCD